MSPPPSPVPSVIIRKSRRPRPPPYTSSPCAAAFASLVTWTDVSGKCAATRSASGRRPRHGRFGASGIEPSGVHHQGDGRAGSRRGRERETERTLQIRIARGHANPLVPRPIDQDRDGLVDEDGPEDLDGDGEITWMRGPDPAGDWIADPGFGFGKTLEHNYELFRNLQQLQLLDTPFLIGISRKSMIYKIKRNVLRRATTLENAQELKEFKRSSDSSDKNV